MGKVNDFSVELFNALNRLKEKGVVKAIGINSFDTEVIQWVINTKKFDVVMLDYNILKQEREPLIKKLSEQGIGVIAGQPMAESLYSNRIFKFRTVKDLWYLARAVVNFRQLLFKGRKFHFVNYVNGMSGSQTALKYVLDNQDVSAAVFGTTSLKHFRENLESRYIEIPWEIKKIREVG